MFHLFNDIMLKELENRKRNYRSLQTHLWELKLSKRITCYFDNKYIEEITSQDILDFFDSIRYKDNGELYSEKYLKSIKAILNSTFNYALDLEIINRNPIKHNFKMPYCQKYNPRNRIVSENTLKELFKVLHNNKRFKIMIPFILLTGMRIGEVCALRWSNIDFQKNTISITNAISRKYCIKKGDIIPLEYDISDTKTYSSVRKIPLTEPVKLLLQNWKFMIEINPKWKKAIQDNGNADLVFPNYQGKVMNYNTLYKSLKNFLKKYEIEDVLFHKLRHNYATDMLIADVDIAVISQLLGHSQISTTCNIYIKDDIIPKINAFEKHIKYLQQKGSFGV